MRIGLSAIRYVMYKTKHTATLSQKPHGTHTGM